MQCYLRIPGFSNTVEAPVLFPHLPNRTLLPPPQSLCCLTDCSGLLGRRVNSGTSQHGQLSVAEYRVTHSSLMSSCLSPAPRMPSSVLDTLSNCKEQTEKHRQEQQLSTQLPEADPHHAVVGSGK
jgi:hypothetical protein